MYWQKKIVQAKQLPHLINETSRRRSVARDAVLKCVRDNYYALELIYEKGQTVQFSLINNCFNSAVRL